MTRHKLDEIDLKILEILQARGQTTRSDLAEEVKLSIPSVSERIRKLSESGFIRSINAILDASKVHLEVTAFILVSSDSPGYYPRLLSELPQSMRYSSAMPSRARAHIF